MINCHPLEVVGRGSETQLEVDEKLNYMKWDDEMKWKTSNAPKSSVSRAQRRCKSETGSIIIVRLTSQFVDSACRDTKD